MDSTKAMQITMQMGLAKLKISIHIDICTMESRRTVPSASRWAA